MSSGKVHVLRSLLSTNEKSFLIRNNGEQVPVEELEGKIVGIYFSSNEIHSCLEFTQKLEGIYKELKDQGESFEIVSVIFHEDNVESFEKSLESLSWLAVPFGDDRGEKLSDHFSHDYFPMIAIIGKGGETIRSDVSDLIEEHGIHAYPFSPKKLAEFKAIEKKRLKAQTLESLLVNGEGNAVIGKDGIEVPVSELVGKTILFYFSSYSCRPCQRFKPKLIKAYHEIKAKDTAFDIIFVSSDKDHSTFDELYSSMPWLALPFGDQRNKSLRHKLKVRHIPTLVVVGPNGQTITCKAKDLLLTFGSNAYPFNEEHCKELMEGWPKRLKHVLHQEHELELSPRYGYNCDVCKEDGSTWSFYCKVCEFYLHPKCALGKDRGKEGDNNPKTDSNHERDNDGWICNGQVCYKV